MCAGAPKEALLREQRRNRLAGFSDSYREEGADDRPHHRSHHHRKRRSPRDPLKPSEPPAKTPRESLEIRIARLGSLGGLFRPSVAVGSSKAPPGVAGEAEEGPQLEQLPPELQGWPPAPQRRVRPKSARLAAMMV